MADQPAERPNVLLITTDQQRFDTIHAAGNDAIFTPHLNWLCDTGIRFSRGYTDCPVCAPARATTDAEGFFRVEQVVPGDEVSVVAIRDGAIIAQAQATAGKQVQLTIRDRQP